MNSSQKPDQGMGPSDQAPRPYTLQPPPWLPSYGQIGDKKVYPDFFVRSEDVDRALIRTVSVLQQGYVVPHAVINEVASAHEPLNQLTQSTTLANFSAAIVSVIKQRRESVHVVRGPTLFKPPPRVTLTDAKRDQWLRDLSNPSIRLRKLSRTIPHGIRGRGLLDSILSRNVRCDRAIWFIRCVGANELRGLKRKGISPAQASSAASKWVSDWTGQVFAWFMGHIELVLHNHPTEEDDMAQWREKLVTCLNLVKQMYVEGLLDKLVWLNLCFDAIRTVDAEQLPFLLMLADAWWSDFVRVRSTARYLLESLLHRYTQLPKQSFTLTELSNLIRRFAQVPDGLYAPKVYHSYKGAFLEIFPLQGTPNLSAEDCKMLHWRNTVTVSPIGGNSTIPLEMIIIESLDSLAPPFTLIDISAKFVHLTTDLSKLVSTLLKWSICQCRPHRLRRIAIATSILHWMVTTGEINDIFDVIQKSVLSLIGMAPQTFSIMELDTNLLFLLCNNLIHFGLFSYARFMRRCVSCGLLAFRRTQLTMQQREYLRALVEIDHSLSSPFVQKQRKIALEQNSVREEENILSAVSAFLMSNTELPNLTRSQKAITARYLVEHCGEFQDSRAEAILAIVLSFEEFHQLARLMLAFLRKRCSRYLTSQLIYIICRWWDLWSANGTLSDLIAGLHRQGTATPNVDFVFNYPSFQDLCHLNEKLGHYSDKLLIEMIRVGEASQHIAPLTSSALLNPSPLSEDLDIPFKDFDSIKEYVHACLSDPAMGISSFNLLLDTLSASPVSRPFDFYTSFLMIEEKPTHNWIGDLVKNWLLNAFKGDRPGRHQLGTGLLIAATGLSFISIDTYVDVLELLGTNLTVLSSNTLTKLWRVLTAADFGSFTTLPELVCHREILNQTFISTAEKKISTLICKSLVSNQDDRLYQAIGGLRPICCLQAQSITSQILDTQAKVSPLLLSTYLFLDSLDSDENEAKLFSCICQNAISAEEGADTLEKILNIFFHQGFSNHFRARELWTTLPAHLPREARSKVWNIVEKYYFPADHRISQIADQDADDAFLTLMRLMESAWYNEGVSSNSVPSDLLANWRDIANRRRLLIESTLIGTDALSKLRDCNVTSILNYCSVLQFTRYLGLRVSLNNFSELPDFQCYQWTLELSAFLCNNMLDQAVYNMFLVFYDGIQFIHCITLTLEELSASDLVALENQSSFKRIAGRSNLSPTSYESDNVVLVATKPKQPIPVKFSIRPWDCIEESIPNPQDNEPCPIPLSAFNARRSLSTTYWDSTTRSSEIEHT